MSKDSQEPAVSGAAQEGGQTAPGDPLGLDDAADQAVEPPPGAGRARGGRLPGTLALLIALAALGGVGYLYYELIHRGDARTGIRLDAMEAELQRRLGEAAAALDARLDELAQRQQTALAEFAEARQAALTALAERQQAAQRASEQALREAIGQVARQTPPTAGEWRQAEARYLLRIANHRLLMERDVPGALQLLRTADAILAELDDFSLHPVRARLADEIAALEAVQDIDLPGLFLRLEAAKRDLGELPLRVPEYRRPAATAARAAEPTAAGAGAVEPAAEAAPADGAWAELQRQLSGLLRVRRLDGDVKPLLAPEEAVYLELNLRLMLERAQLAAMNREQQVFEQSLASAGDWVRRYLNADAPVVQRLMGELAALQTLDLEQPLPDVSGSLNALQQAQGAPE